MDGWQHMVVRNVIEDISIQRVLESFIDNISISSNDNILIKPNFVSLDRYPYTTSWDLLATIIGCLENKGCRRITIAEAPSPDHCVVFKKKTLPYEIKKSRINQFHQILRNSDNIEDAITYYKSREKLINEYYNYFFSSEGYTDSIAGIPVVNLFNPELDLKYKELMIANNVKVYYLDMSSFDIIINLPVLKLHTVTGFTGALKNFYALFSTFDKLQLHRHHLVGKALCCLHKALDHLNIHTFLDGRNIPYTQQALYGSENFCKLNMVFHGNNLLEIDSQAVGILLSEGLLNKVTDNTYINYLQST